MTAKLIVSVKEVNGIAQVVYCVKERRRICRNKFAQTVAEFKANYRNGNLKSVNFVPPPPPPGARRYARR